MNNNNTGNNNLGGQDPVHQQLTGADAALPTIGSLEDQVNEVVVGLFSQQLASAAAGPANGGSLEDQLDEMLVGLSHNLDETLGLEKKDDADAQYGIGCQSMRTGKGNDALKWFRLAADQGHAGAFYDLGAIYYRGLPTTEADSLGVPEDKVNAKKWFRLAAASGDARAQWALGDMYTYGDGVEKNEVEGFKWFQLAAKAQHMDAQRETGVAYRFGVGVEQDLQEAEKWFNLAAAQGDEDAQRNLKELESGTRIGVTEAEEGDVHAQFALGRVFFQQAIDGGHDGPEAELANALKWFSLAADIGHEPSIKMVKMIEEWKVGGIEKSLQEFRDRMSKFGVQLKDL